MSQPRGYTTDEQLGIEPVTDNTTIGGVPIRGKREEEEKEEIDDEALLAEYELRELGLDPPDTNMTFGGVPMSSGDQPGGLEPQGSLDKPTAATEK